MRKLNQILKTVSILFLVLSVSSVTVLGYNEPFDYSVNSSYDPEVVIKDMVVNSNSTTTSINPLFKTTIGSTRETINRHAIVVNSDDSYLNKVKNVSPVLTQVDNSTIPSCLVGTTTRNVSNSSDFQDALNSPTVTCINITSGFTITLTTLGQVYATLPISKTIVNSSSNVNAISVYAYLYNTNYQKLFHTTSNVNITLYNITINYSEGLIYSNHNLFYGFNTINLNKTKVLQNGVLGYSALTNDNTANIIGSSEVKTNTINITNGSVITGASSDGNIILANNINISQSSILTHMSNRAGIYAFNTLNIEQGSIIDNVVYNNATGMYAGEALMVNDSTVNVSYMKLALQSSTIKYGIVVEKKASITNSIINVLTGNSTSSLSLLIESRPLATEPVNLNSTTINVNDVSRLFSGKALYLYNSHVINSNTLKYTNPSGSTYRYISSDLLSLQGSSITFNTEIDKFFGGNANTYGDLMLNSSSLNLNYTGNFSSELNTVYLSDVKNLSINNGDIKVNHFGSRVTGILGTSPSPNPATLGFARVLENMSITGNTNRFSLKKATLNGNTISENNYNEGFLIASEHTFLKMISDSSLTLNEARLIYNGNVTLVSTERNLDINLNNSEILANMSEGTNSTSISAHSFISLRNRDTGSIDIVSENSKIEIDHNSNYNSSTALKPTISIIDDVNILANQESKISYLGNNSTLKITDKTVSGFSTPATAESNASILSHKLVHNASPLEFSSLVFNSNSTFEFYNNHAMYPIIRTKSFIANNSNVLFNFANYYQSDDSINTAYNYYHLFYDQIDRTIFDFNLDRSASNYIGAILKFSVTSARNNLTPYILTNGSANITATIDYYNYANYGGSDYGREGLPSLSGDVKQTVSVKGGRAQGSTTFAAQTESFEQFGTNAGPQSNINIYPSGIPACLPNNQFGGRTCILTDSKPFYSGVNRRRDAVYGDYVIKLDELLTYDESRQEYFVTGMASKDTTITIVNNAVFDTIPLANGLYRFKISVNYDNSITNYAIKASHKVKDGTSSPLTQNNTNAIVNFTRLFGYNVVQPNLDFTVGSSLEFGTQTISGNEQYLSRRSSNVFNIQVLDTRYNSPGWVLELCVVEGMSTVRNQIRTSMYNNFVYKNGDNSYTTLNDNCTNRVVVSENSQSKPLLTDIVWNHTQGIQLYIDNPWLILNGMEYQGIIRFILTSKTN